MIPHSQPLPLPALPADQLEALTDLYRRGTPENTLRAWERDLAYVAAWKQAAFGTPLDWPESEAVALRFVLDHSIDLTETPGPARDAANVLIALGLRRSLARPRAPKSENPITREVLEAMLAACDHSHRGLRDRAALCLGWASGGRRRSEIVALNVDDIDTREFDTKGILRIRLLTTKTTGPAAAPHLPLKGRTVMRWIAAAQITENPAADLSG